MLIYSILFDKWVLWWVTLNQGWANIFTQGPYWAILKRLQARDPHKKINFFRNC
jgi:hypothetical protein